ncbi:hypothetical protein [Streptacidiphilus rugosus]|uniref:hypothetical protein n=1 Tax=Streptacidiphilus rugosus TaxID=405783 RepID=UPI00068AAC50|nr:hypothetical protein [Streptacidiphilus rugosus]
MERAIARVAEAFAGMTAHPDEAGCGRCYSAEEIALLRTAHVALPADLVCMVAEEVPGHWDDHPSVIRRVLPQVAVLLAQGATSPDLMARGLAAARWTQWPDQQVQALRGFLEAWWLGTLEQDSPPTSAREVFESCVTATSSVTPWLAWWDAGLGPVASRHLEECADWWWDDLQNDVSPFAWWWGTEAQERAACAELRTWLAARVPFEDDAR